MTTENGRHALVIGGSMTGLLTAQVLTRYFERVTILERDQLPTDPEHRQGVPQSRHLHVLLAKGAQVIESLFPGLLGELTKAGAFSFDLSSDALVRMRGHWMPRHELGVTGLNCSRVLLEGTIRQRLLAQPQVSICQGADVTTLLTDETQHQVIGVGLSWRRHAQHKGSDKIMADFVVDATGRQSRAPQWLSELGYETPQETVVNPHMGYASRRYKGIAADWQMLFVFAEPPDKPKGGAILKEEGDTWVATVVGFSKVYPPTDEEGFMAFAQEVAPELYQVLQQAEPISPISGYRRTENRWRHYERLSRWPENFVVMGDAACAFNPIYGQGMTAAAIGAEALDGLLQQRHGNTDRVSAPDAKAAYHSY